ncbi:MAG: type II toxin-antitoxin system MqsA family antitoxin [Clostridia bacterium]|nr:type II toxin-antitoxin system MqsA family antitoxin [Clostridia bacterium]
MTEQCFYCKGNIKNDTRTHVVDLGKCVIIIRNTPCMTCEQCGESYYTDDVQKRLDEIIKSVSGLMTEIAVIEYSDNAA